MKNILITGTLLIIGIGAWYVLTNTKTETPIEIDTAELVPAQDTEIKQSEQEEELRSGDTPSMEAEGKVFTVAGVNYAYDVSEITVKEGDTVTIQFQSTDGFHDWVVDEFDAATDKVRPGAPTSVTFVASKAGTYEYYCSVGNHRAEGMVGKLIVE